MECQRGWMSMEETGFKNTGKIAASSGNPGFPWEWGSSAFPSTNPCCFLPLLSWFGAHPKNPIGSGGIRGVEGLGNPLSVSVGGFGIFILMGIPKDNDSRMTLGVWDAQPGHGAAAPGTVGFILGIAQLQAEFPTLFSRPRICSLMSPMAAAPIKPSSAFPLFPLNPIFRIFPSQQKDVPSSEDARNL